MQPIYLILALALFSKDGNLKQSLNELLTFYRENRELIAMLTQANPLSSPKAEEGEKEDEQEKSRPEQPIGNEKVLQEFLKNYGV